MPRMSKSLDGPAPTISVKLEMPMPISSPLLRFSACSLRSAGVADDVHRLLERRRVVAAVVFPAERRLVRELVRRDEVLHSQLRRIHLQLLRQDVRHSLDRVHGLGDAEGAAVRDAARRLVRVDAVHLGERVLQVVGAGADREQAGRELRRVGRRVRVAVIGHRLDLERGHRAVLLRAQRRLHVVVAREGVGLQVLHPVLDPLDRLADDDRGRHRDDVARIDGHLPAEAAADVGRDDADLLLGEPDVPGDEREDRADRVRRLRRHVDGELAAHAVEVRHACRRSRSRRRGCAGDRCSA